MDVTLAQGAFRGVRDREVLSFKGIPYAAPPVGDLRFAAPLPTVPHDGVADATAYGPTVSTPPQRSAVIDELLPDPVRAGENGLNLNVWTPDVAADLPVFVWIHGGGFVTGAGSTSAFDGTAFARDGVVTVTINYRLAAEGFLYLPDTVPNRGLLDQIAALEWVRDNITAFGGDPKRVTVAGESAGAMAVLTMLTMPSARGLFRRAIAQSGGGHHVHTPEVAEAFTAELCAELGVPRRVDGVAGVPAGKLHAATNEVISRVNAGKDTRFAEFRRLALQPVIDGKIVPRHPIDAVLRGDTNDFDLLIGTNADEYGLFCAPNRLADVLDERMLTATTARLGVDPDVMVERYRAGMPGASRAELFVAIQSDWFCTVPTVRYVDARGKAGAASHVYEFTWRPDTYGGTLGACHTLEVPFVFETLDDPWGIELRGVDAPRHLAAEVHRAWVDFIATGDPGWEPYGATRKVRRLDLASVMVENPGAFRRQAWEGLI